jgi:hypothetical protein
MENALGTTFYKAHSQSEAAYKQPRISSEATGRLADVGKGVSQFFANEGRMTAPMQRVKAGCAPVSELGRTNREHGISNRNTTIFIAGITSVA